MMTESIVKLGVVCLLLGYAQAQSPGCDFYQQAVPGRTYYITNPGYPGNYTPGIRCRWILNTTLTNYRFRLDCPLINLPASPSCSLDRFLVSRSGDPQLASADYYCGGPSSLTGIYSTGRMLSLGLVTTSSTNSRGGTFSCQVALEQVSTTPAPPTSCNCGYKRGNRIVGGDPTRANEYPMMAGVIYYETRSIKCGAVIISEQYVVSAAHCMVGRAASNTGVIVGEHDVSTGSDSSATQGFLVESYLVHPQYTESNYDYDISVIKIQGSMVFSELVGPVCLPFKFASATFAGANATLLGWGTQFPGGPTSNVLRKVNVQIISQAQCQATYSSLTARQMCTYTPGKDACQDDSGGPVLYTDPSTGRLFNVGIISYGRFCASPGYPGINTRITTLLDWIVRVAPANYCRV